tara:strand:- start:3467 stop:3898 length:432 start_codon:yes stop_codon:yes gene_type:complete
MTSKLVLDNIAGRTTAGSISVVAEGNGTTTNLQQGLIKQWVNLTAATPAYKDSFNASTITDEGLGIYEYPFTNPMGNANYSAVGCASTKGSNNSYTAIVTTGDSANSYGLHSTAAIRFNAYANNATALTDQDTVNSMVSGDLA